MARDFIVDEMKGFGMILVIIGHMSICKDLNLWIYSFHMPLFIFVSALYIKDFSRDELRKKINRLLLPFIVFSLLSWLCYTILTYLYYPEQFSEQLKKIVYILALTGQNGCSIWNKGNVTLWFLPCLFLCIIAYWLSTYLKWKYIDIILSILLSYFCAFCNLKLPANLDTAFLLYPFFKLAIVYKALNIKTYLLNMSLLYKIVMFVFLLALQVFLVSVNGHVDTASNVFGKNLIIFYLTACVGIFITILFFNICNYRSHLISYIGRNSITYLIFHVPLLQISNYMLNSNEPLNIALKFLFVLFLIVPLNYIIVHYCPILLGIKR